MGVIDGTIPFISGEEGKSYLGSGTELRLGPCNIYWGNQTGTALTGTADATASTAIVGTGTSFDTELVVGDYISFGSITDQTFRVVSITDATNITIDQAVTIVADSMTKVSLLSLGGTDATTLKFGINKTELKESQKGDSPADMAVTGYMCEVEMGLTRPSLSRMDRILQGFSTFRNVGTGDIDGAGFGFPIGETDLEIVAPLHLVRIVKGAESTDPKDHLTILRAAPMVDAEDVKDATTQLIFKTMFRGYIDETTELGGVPLLFKLGAIS